MKKTLLITYFFPPQIGGIENYYNQLLKHLPKDKIVVLTQNYQQSLEIDTNCDYPIYRTNFFGSKLPPKWWSLKKEIDTIIKKEKIEQLVFGHFHPWTILGNYFRLPFYIFGHGTDIRQIKVNWWQRFTFKKIMNSCQDLIVNSNYLAEQARALISPFNFSKVKVIYPGINLVDINNKHTRSELRNKFGFTDNDIILISLGRLVKDKNYLAAIELMPELLKLFSNLKYIIVGSGEEEASLKARVKELNLESVVKFLGEINDNDALKWQYYQMSDIFFGVSQVPEGFGISYVEAQACGLPVIASKFGGSAEAIVDQQTGILVDPKKIPEITEAIKKLVDNIQFRSRLSHAGISRAKIFDWKNQAQKIELLLK